MPINSEECVKLICTLAEEKKLKVAVTESLKGGLIAGACAVGGGLLLGPVGLAVGGAVGGLVAASTSKNYLSVVEVIQNMRPEHKERLANCVREITNGVKYSDAVALGAVVMGNQVMKQQILTAARSYMEKEMKMKIVD